MREIKIIQEEFDPICTRVSVGGREDIGYYGVYRGTIEDSIACLRIVLEEMERKAGK